MVKTRVASRVKAAVGGKKSHNESQDLVKLTEKYNVFCKRLHGLIEALKAHYVAMQGLAKSRYTVAQHLAELSKDGPLFERTGEMPSEEKSSEAVQSYLSIQDAVAGKAKMYASKYAQFVVDYAVEWDKVVTTRVNRGLKQAEQYRVELDHYQAKVEALRQSANSTMAKGKQVDPKAADKLTRNEDKLVKIRETHNKFVASLCTLIDEVTDRSWRDLHPLLVKVAQFEVTLSGDEAKGLAALNAIVSDLKRLAVTHGIKPQARLKDLDSLDPSMLSTKAPESNAPLAIEAGFNGMTLGGSSTSPSNSGGGFGPSLMDDHRFPPGSVAPQGMGGFPVAVSSSDNRSVSTGSFDGSFVSGYTNSAVATPSTLDMLAISASAAPPPTVDQLSAAFGPAPSSAPSYGSLPPLGPSGGSSVGYGPGQATRKHSTDSFDSAFSGASAPPPAAPPPPPPTQFGQAGAANTNPFGPGPPAPAPSYGAPNPFGAAPPQTNLYASTSYGAPNPYPPPSYGTPPLPPSYGQAPASSPYGQPPAYGQTNPFGSSPSTNPFG